MTLYLSNRDGNGKTSEEGHYKFQTSVWAGAVLGATAFQVTQNSPLGRNVVVGAGQIKIDTSLDYAYTGWNTSPVVIAITTADPANPRISTIVAYVDKGATTSASPPNNPGIIKLMSVDGSPNAVPVAPNAGTIQSAVGAGNPYVILADVRTNAGATQIVTANITDRRSRVTLGTDLIGTSSVLDGAITTPKLADTSVSTAKLANLAATTAKLADGAVTTPKFRPTVIESNFTLAGSRFTTPAAQGFYTIPNASMTYTAGSTNETLILWTSAMAMKNAAPNAELYLYVNGVAYGISAYLEFGNAWYRMNMMNMLNVNAGQTVTLSVVIYNASTSTTSVINEVAKWKPMIQGFSVYRP